MRSSVTYNIPLGVVGIPQDIFLSMSEILNKKSRDECAKTNRRHKIESKIFRILWPYRDAEEPIKMLLRRLLAFVFRIFRNR